MAYLGPHVSPECSACLCCTSSCFSSHVLSRPDISPSFLTLVSSLMLAPHPDCCMKFSPQFSDSVLGECFGEAKLEGPSGWVWCAEFKRNRSSMLLTGPGWGDFAADHALEVGDVLIFTYFGRNLFKVCVFEANAGVEKSKHCLPTKRNRVHAGTCIAPEPEEPGDVIPERFINNAVCRVQEEEEETAGKLSRDHPDAEKIDNEIPCSETAYQNQDYQELRHATQKTNSSLQDSENHSNTEYGKLLVRSGDEYRSSCRRPRKNSNVTRHSIIRQAHGACEDSKMSRKNQAFAGLSVVPDSERDRVIKEANAFESKYPIARKIVTYSSLHADLKCLIPASFANKYLPNRDTILTFVDPKGREWKCKWLGGHRIRPFVSAGWSPFAKGQGLQVHDVCIFELTNQTTFQFNVHFFRVKAALHDDGFVHRPLMRGQIETRDGYDTK